MLRISLSKLQLARDVWRRKFGLLLFDKKDKKNNRFGLSKKINRIVLVRWDAKLGDAIVSSFVIREWRKAYPGIKIDIITTPAMASFFRDYFNIDVIFEINKRPSYRELKKLATSIGEVDLLVHLSKMLKMKDLYFMNKVKAKNIVGIDDSVGMINIKLGEITKSNHFSDKFRVLLEQTKVQNVDSQYIIPQNSESQERVDSFLTAFEHPILAFNPYGSGNERQISRKKIEEIINVIFEIKKSVVIVLLVAPDKKEEVVDISSQYKKVFFYDKSETIHDSISIMRRAKWVVSVDTATVHIAVGLNKPLLAFYNPDYENFIEWGYKRDNVINVFSDKGTPQSIGKVDDNRLSKAISELLNNF